MPETIVKSPYGDVTVTHPSGASDAEIIEYAKKNYNPTPIGEDIGRSVMAAPRKAIEGLIGLPGTANELIGIGIDKLTGQPSGTLAKMQAEQRKNSLLPDLSPPTPQDIQAQTSKILGPSYQPTTTPGKYAGSAVEGITGALTGGGALIPKVMMGAASGLGAEAAGEAIPENSWMQTPGRLLGGLMGGVSAILAGKGLAGARNYAAAKNTGSDIGQAIGGAPVVPGAVRRLAGDVQADRLTTKGVTQTANALGPEARLLDVGRQLEQRGAVGLTRIPGQAQSDILNTIEGRTGKLLPTGKYEPGAQSAQRLSSDFDTSMGPVHDLVKLQGDIHERFGPLIKDAYQKVMSQHDDIGIPDAIKARPAIQSAMEGADELARNYGAIPKRGSLEYWDYVKKSLDQRINSLIRTGTDSVGKADLGGLLDSKRMLVNYLDEATKDATGQSGYQMARQLSATKKGLEEAAEFGPTMFNNRVLPEITRQQFQDMSVLEQATAKASIRRELDRLMGSVGNDASKAKALFSQNNVLEKAAAIFGPDAAEILKSAVNRENSFQGTTNAATRQSITNLAKNVTEDMRDVPQNMQVPNLYSALTSLPRAGAQYLHGQGMETTRQDLARTLLSKSEEIPLVVKLLTEYNQKTAANAAAPTSMKMNALIRALISQGVAHQSQ